MFKTRPKGKRILAIYYGMARIGLALSDEQKIIASPLFVVTTEKRSEKTLNKLLQELKKHQEAFNYDLEEIIIGLPLMMNGTSGLSADEVQHFANLLKAHIETPIVLWDERLTTVQAERALREGELTRKQRTKFVDTVSAAILLQSYLDYKSIPKN